jgi:hypothetical protein
MATATTTRTRRTADGMAATAAIPLALIAPTLAVTMPIPTIAETPPLRTLSPVAMPQRSPTLEMVTAMGPRTTPSCAAGTVVTAVNRYVMGVAVTSVEKMLTFASILTRRRPLL